MKSIIKLTLLFLIFFYGCKSEEEIVQYSLTVTTNGSGIAEPNQGTYNENEILEILAVANDGWQFDNWTGDLNSNSSTETITFDNNKNITANFSLIQQIDFLGEIESTNSIGGSLNETLESIIATTDGGFASIGYTQSIDGDNTDTPNGLNDYWIVKYDSNLTLQFSKTFGGSADDRAKSIIQTQDGGYLISGFTKSNDFDVTENHGQKDFWIIKLDSNGNMQWQKTHGYSGDDEGFSIIQTQDGGYFTCGYIDVTASGGLGNDDAGRNSQQNIGRNSQHGVGDYWGIKLDINGDFIWRRYFGGNKNDRAYDVLQANNGDFIIVGAAESEAGFDLTDPKGGYDFWITRISNEGNLIWQKSFGGSETEECYKIIPTNDGNFFLLGKTQSNDQDAISHGSFDIFLVKMNPNGDKIWSKTYGGNQFDSANDIISLNDGNYMIAGLTRSDDIYEIKGQNDILLLKIDSNGTVLNQYTFGGSAIDVATSLIETDNNGLIVVGNSTSNDFDITSNNGFTDALILHLK